MKKRTRQQISLDLAKKLDQPIIFYTCGDQYNYNWWGVAYPSGKIYWHVAGACTFFNSRLSAEKKRVLKHELKESDSLIAYIKKELNALDYKGASLKNYE